MMMMMTMMMMMMMDYVVCFALLAMGRLRALFMIPLSCTASVYFWIRALDGFVGVCFTCIFMHLAFSLWVS